jgi:hypothetical protein
MFRRMDILTYLPPENNHDWDLLLDVRKNGHNPLTNGRLLDVLPAPCHHVDPEGAGGPAAVLQAGPDLCLVGKLS